MEGLVYQVQQDSKTLKAELGGTEGRLSSTEKVVKVTVENVDNQLRKNNIKVRGLREGREGITSVYIWWNFLQIGLV